MGNASVSEDDNYYYVDYGSRSPKEILIISIIIVSLVGIGLMIGGLI